MLTDPSCKYFPFVGPALADRRWPSRRITTAPRWLSTDLRDGNQALVDPMDNTRKLRLWDRLLAIGFKEIEVAFPSASQTDFDFVRCLIEEQRIPDDVTLQVLTPARSELIHRTFEVLAGASRAAVHLYHATAPIFREVVFGKSRTEVIAMAVESMRLMCELAEARPETKWCFEYSPETFSATEPEFAKGIIDAVSEVVGTSQDCKLVVNLPNTVEMATPNVYADQIEWMHRNLDRREKLILSVHPHNDRGTAVAAAELALLAGAERVEGCLFGNGERTGNVCLVTLAMNLYSQGIDPHLDFGDINAVRVDHETCTGLPVHPRHPYAGDLVYTAFSGSHQDAIRKGLAVQKGRERWDVPYLPVDPADVGCGYQAVVRVNSQSGKGGIAFLLEREYGLSVPPAVLIELRDAVQAITDREGGEVDAERIHAVLEKRFISHPGRYRYLHHSLEKDSETSLRISLRVELQRDGRPWVAQATGRGPIEAFAAALDGMQVLDYHEHAVESGASATAAAYIALRGGDGKPVWGIGLDSNIVTASLKAMVSAVNRMA